MELELGEIGRTKADSADGPGMGAGVAAAAAKAEPWVEETRAVADNSSRICRLVRSGRLIVICRCLVVPSGDIHLSAINMQ